MIFFSEVILFYIGKLRSVSVEKKFKMHLALSTKIGIQLIVLSSV